MATVTNVRFEHYRAPFTLGVDETKPRLSWQISAASDDDFVSGPWKFSQNGYEVELRKLGIENAIYNVSCESSENVRVPWPFHNLKLQSRDRVQVRVRVWDGNNHATPWSEPPASLEVGLLDRNDWTAERIAAPWSKETAEPQPEDLYRKQFLCRPNTSISQARLYITAQGVYEAEINGQRIGDHVLAPGWTAYDARLQYQTYDVTPSLKEGIGNCLGVRVAEGWFCGRIGFEGGHRNIWGGFPALIAQLEVVYADGQIQTVATDSSWLVAEGPIRLAEIYDGEKYDATQEIPLWSSSVLDNNVSPKWKPVRVLDPLPASISLVSGYSEPVRRIEKLKPVEPRKSPSGKSILDFGQNLVGFLHLDHINGPRGHKIILSHAEVLDETGELAIRPLRMCKAQDIYTLDGRTDAIYEPRFTFHGFRYAQIEGWLDDERQLLESVQAVVCHTDMAKTGIFHCSWPKLEQLHQNAVWSMRGNFLSVPTDCPQRDERLGWSGDFAMFAPTAVLLYDCFNISRNWLVDLRHDQTVLGGVPPMVSPNATLADPVWCRRVPCAIWHDVTILGPWTLYLETGDVTILKEQYGSMMDWMRVIPRNKSGATHLWDPTPFQLGDWLDPNAPPDQPWKCPTDAKMVANMFLVQSLRLMIDVSRLLGKTAESESFSSEYEAALDEFHSEYVTINGRLVSDTQASYALAICLGILRNKSQLDRAGNRLSELVRKDGFHIATGFAGTPFVCEALARTGHVQVAYAMLSEESCPSFLYPITMGATTTWERWDSMLPDGRVNPGEMTSFNHYALGAVSKFLHEHIAGLRSLEPGWKRCSVAPMVAADLTSGGSSHATDQGIISCAWKTTKSTSSEDEDFEDFHLTVSVPYGTIAEVALPGGDGIQTVEAGTWQFKSKFRRDGNWPVKALPAKS